MNLPKSKICKFSDENKINSKELIDKILIDIYNNLDEYSKDLIRAYNFDVEFKNLYLVDCETGKKKILKDLIDCEYIESFEALPRKYKIKKVDMKQYNEYILTIHLNSRKSDHYSFEKYNYEVIPPAVILTNEHRDRIQQWSSLTDEELDGVLFEFDKLLGNILTELTGDKNKDDIVIFMDVFMELEKIVNVVDDSNDILMIWIHPLFVYSDRDILKGLIAYELSKYDKKWLEKHYKYILKYCKEYNLLTGKNLEILKRIREIAIKRKDNNTINIINELEFI
ncbi:hypothetical protein [Methanococcus aeolicus]|uniref:Uncharacterized protein n=1 Tax=Methanococcus aeolicus (strain ATCC BAA-1280 / DSM 17508 / OCM 812 / Nankai-3) TaxID=419665 RepID=A6UW64_META3|nr:hypothetical protein [Methanococcus aeolicus]ABR56736.1 conserved hypothetical protein [Methanococcus aeolicus Nankai-3]UXM84736.1 hypothetical protein N6C89_00090 [Methanococcus aeolicus]